MYPEIPISVTLKKRVEKLYDPPAQEFLEDYVFSRKLQVLRLPCFLRGPSAKGFSLIEVVIAISVVALTFIGLIGLLGVGAANDQASSRQTVATNIAGAILTDLRSTPAYSTMSPRFGLTLPTSNAGTASAPFGTTPSYLYFDNSASFLPLSGPTAYSTAQSPAPTGAVYVAVVYLSQIVSIGPSVSTATTPKVWPQGNDAARTVVYWPAQTPAGTAPAGSVDVISQFLVH